MTPTASLEAGPVHLEQQGTVIRQRMSFDDEEALKRYRAETEAWVESIPEQLEALRERLRATIAPYDAFDVLSNVWVANTPADPDAYKESSEEGLLVIPEYVALACLERPDRAGEEPREAPVDATVLEPIDEIVREIMMLNSWHSMHKIMSAQGDEPASFRELRARWVSRELLVQGPGFEFQERDLIDNLFGDDEDRALSRAIGFTSGEAVLMADALIAIGMTRFAFQREAARSFVEGLEGEAGCVQDGVDSDFVRRLRGMGEQERKRFLANVRLGASFHRLGDTFQVTATQVAEAAAVDAKHAQAFLKSFSVGFGQTWDSASPMEIHRLRRTPIVDDGTGNYLVISHQLLFWTLRPALEDALKATGGRAWTRFSDRRGSLVEERALEHLARAMPSAKTYRGLSFDIEEDGELIRYETDGLMICDTVAFVVESKAGSVTPPARRGAPDRIRRHLRDVIVEGSEQAHRTIKALSDPSVKFIDAQGAEVALPREQTSAFPIVLTLDEFGPATTMIWELGDAGLLSSDDPPPWVLTLFELELIVELVEYEAFFVQFLRRRARLNEHRRVIAFDELDWWMHYLTRGLFFDDELAAEGAPDVINLLSFTDDLDAYFLWTRGDRSKPAKKPRQKLHGELRKLLDDLATAEFTGWLEASAALLETNDSSRQRMVSLVRRMHRQTLSDKQDHSLAFLCGGEGHPWDWLS
ncbi:MAG: hypothetical protein R2700_04720 [Solirubrobacterales bacterium]